MTDISKIKAVAFDCDGVLFDTALANRKFYDEVLESFGKPILTDEQFVQVHMMTVGAAIAYLFPETDDYTDIFKCLKQIGYPKFIRYMKMEEGLRELLADLAANGYTRAIATNRTDTMAKVLADYDLTDCFEMVMTAADVEKPKPDPEQLLRIMDRFNLKPENLIFIGDSRYDREAARAAGTAFVAFKQPGLEADFHVTAMAEIRGVLQINK